MTARLPGCGAPATHLVEIYSPRETAHRSLDAGVYVCAEHHAPAREALDGAGLTPYSIPVTNPRLAGRCGDGYDFTTGEPINAPEPTAEPEQQPRKSAAEEYRQAQAKVWREHHGTDPGIRAHRERWGKFPDADPAHGNSGPGGPLPLAAIGAGQPERVRRFDTDAGRWRWWLVADEMWADDYQIVVRDADDDSYVDVVRDGAVLVTWTFAEACDVGQQLADLFGTFTGPASARPGNGAATTKPPGGAR